MTDWPSDPTLPETGLGEDATRALFDAAMYARSVQLGSPVALAHMDPPPAPIAAELVAASARLNQNLLHPDLSPFATEAEDQALRWLAPFFGMASGHICAGSTLANLTALWAAREQGCTTVVASEDAHISIAKSARILGLPCTTLPTDSAGRMRLSHLPELADAALVLTAGTTGRGAIDPLRDPPPARWLHIDAAWAGPLRLTRFADRLAGLEAAQSVAVSAHKWLFQPKDSALVLFRDPQAQSAISFGGAYLARPNVGVQGSRSAAGVALLGTLMALGRSGLAARIETCMDIAEGLANRLSADPRCDLLAMPETGVVNWRPTHADFETVAAVLGPTASRTAVHGESWLRHAAANPHADLEAIWQRIDAALSNT